MPRVAQVPFRRTAGCPRQDKSQPPVHIVANRNVGDGDSDYENLKEAYP